MLVCLGTEAAESRPRSGFRPRSENDRRRAGKQNSGGGGYQDIAWRYSSSIGNEDAGVVAAEIAVHMADKYARNARVALHVLQAAVTQPEVDQAQSQNAERCSTQNRDE